MTEKNLINHYLYLRAVQVILDIGNNITDTILMSVLEDLQKNPPAAEKNDPFHMASVWCKINEYRIQIGKYSGFAGELLEKYVIPKMTKEDVDLAEKKVGDFVKKISERDDFVDFLKSAFHRIMTEHGIRLVKRFNGDVTRPGELK